MPALPNPLRNACDGRLGIRQTQEEQAHMIALCPPPPEKPALANSQPTTESSSMKITEAVRKYAAEQAISKEEALQRGMEEKPKEFVEAGAEVYTTAKFG